MLPAERYGGVYSFVKRGVAALGTTTASVGAGGVGAESSRWNSSHGSAVVSTSDGASEMQLLAAHVSKRLMKDVEIAMKFYFVEGTDFILHRGLLLK